MAIVISLYSAFKEEHRWICWCWNIFYSTFSQLVAAYAGNYIYSMSLSFPRALWSLIVAHRWMAWNKITELEVCLGHSRIKLHSLHGALNGFPWSHFDVLWLTHKLSQVYEPSHNWQQSDHLNCSACIITAIMISKMMSIMSTLIKMNTFIQSAQTAEVNMVYSNSGASHFRDHYTVNSTWKSQWALWLGDGFVQVGRQRQNERQCECESSVSTDCE